MRALVYAPEPTRHDWIESELEDQPVVVQTCRSIGDLVAALVFDPPPRPQVLIADFDALTAAELLHIHAIREQGWFGIVFAVGDVPAPIRRTLSIDRVFSAPLSRDGLRTAIATVSHSAHTVRMPREIR
jgi:hypothetical protein